MAAFVHCNFKSNILRMAVDVSVLLPDKARVEQLQKGEFSPCLHKTMYLLHGFSGDYMSFIRSTNIERFADEYQIAVVTPSMYNSAYTDMKYGLDYFSYLSMELVDFIERTFPVSRSREDRFAVGMSMGGYGAYKWGLTHPEMFTAIAGISGSYHAEYRYQGRVSTVSTLCEALYGDPPAITPEEHDLFVLIEKLKASGKEIPRMYICCGTEDRQYSSAVDLKQKADELDIEMFFKPNQPGKHDFLFFDQNMPLVLKWLVQKP